MRVLTVMGAVYNGLERVYPVEEQRDGAYPSKSPFTTRANSAAAALKGCSWRITPYSYIDPARSADRMRAMFDSSRETLERYRD